MAYDSLIEINQIKKLYIILELKIKYINIVYYNNFL